MKRTTRLRAFIEHESSSLISTLRFYLSRAGTADQPLEAAAYELLNEVVVEALEHEERFRSDGQPRAWLLGIAANIIKRRQVERAKRDQREPLVRDLFADDGESLSDDELFDRMSALADADPYAETENELTVLMGTLSEDDQRVLRLAILTGLDGDSVARELGTTPGAARVRLHRALNRLRAAYQAQQKANL